MTENHDHAKPIATSLTSSMESSEGITGNILELQKMLSDDTRPPLFEPLGGSAAMRNAVEQAKRFAAASATVLLSGESGTGKEVVARFIHEISPRRELPYVRVNCAAIPETLMESELFGHERGAFTGAVQSRRGRMAAAEGGTILLDEISEIPLSMQAKLLRVLEEEEFQPLGGDATMLLSARVIATTNRCLEAAVREGTFREDLYYRLNVLHIDLPPLRERPEDIDELVQHFIQSFHNEAPTPIRGIREEAASLLRRSPWSGNVRQLRNAIHRACIVCQTGILTSEDFAISDAATPPQPHGAVATNLESLSLEDAERYLVLRAIERNGGNKTAAARELDISPRTITNKLHKYSQRTTPGMARAA